MPGGQMSGQGRPASYTLSLHHDTGSRTLSCQQQESRGRPSCAQSHPTLCDPMDCSPPGSFVHEILQAKILEQLPIPFFRGYS